MTRPVPSPFKRLVPYTVPYVRPDRRVVCLPYTGSAVRQYSRWDSPSRCWQLYDGHPQRDGHLIANIPWEHIPAYWTD